MKQKLYRIISVKIDELFSDFADKNTHTHMLIDINFYRWKNKIKHYDRYDERGQNFPVISLSVSE